MNPGRIVMHQYLVGKGMHPQDAEHVVINSGAGIVDWFKKHKGKILGALGTVGALAASAAIKNYQNNKNAEQVVDAFRRGMSGHGLFDTIKDLGSDAIKRYGPQIIDYGINQGAKYVKNYLKKPKKPKQLSKQAQTKELMKENNILMRSVSPYFKKQLLLYRKEKLGEFNIRQLLNKVLIEGEQEENVIEDLETNGLEGLGIIDWFKKHKDNLYAIGKAGYDLYK